LRCPLTEVRSLAHALRIAFAWGAISGVFLALLLSALGVPLLLFLLADLTDPSVLIEGVTEIGLEIVSPTNDDERSAIVSLKIPADFDTGEVVKQLQDEYGILVTNRSGFLRVSPHIDNTPEQITFFLESLCEILNYNK